VTTILHLTAQIMSSSNDQDGEGGNDLTPNTLAEAESAFTFNSSFQTSSAGKPQPTTPLPLHSSDTSNYLSAASAAGLAVELPYPDDVPIEHVRGLPPGALSRGTTQAVLEKMDSGTSLGRRGSKEGERRTRDIQVPFKKEGGKVDGSNGGVNSGVAKPGFDRRQSWNKEDLKRFMSERLMTGEGGGDENAGYVSKN